MTLLRMEEHAFYLVVIKLTASVAVAFPERLSPEQRVLGLHPVGILSKCIGSVHGAGKERLCHAPVPRSGQLGFGILSCCLSGFDAYVDWWCPLSPGVDRPSGNE